MARNTETSPPIDRPGESSIQFRVTQEGFASGRAIFVRVAKVLGPSLALIAESSPSLKSIKLAPAVRAALEGMTDADLDFLTEKFGASSEFSIDGGAKWPRLSKENREEIFGGNMLLFFRWIQFALETNFADFFGALSALRDGGREGDTRTSSQASPKP